MRQVIFSALGLATLVSCMSLAEGTLMNSNDVSQKFSERNVIFVDSDEGMFLEVFVPVPVEKVPHVVGLTQGSGKKGFGEFSSKKLRDVTEVEGGVVLTLDYEYFASRIKDYTDYLIVYNYVSKKYLYELTEDEIQYVREQVNV